ncbi:MAG: helix-turn-helix domain-containing protein, partial [Gemmatimonas sp.]
MTDDDSNIALQDLPNDVVVAEELQSDKIERNGTDPALTDTYKDLAMLPFAEARAKALERFDRQFLSTALARHNGNIARTARALGLHRQSLQKLMARRGIKS